MGRKEIMAHNARIIRNNVRGKTRKERALYYSMLRMGPLGPAVVALAAMSAGYSGLSQVAPIASK